MKIDLGCKVTDKVTGFAGIVTGIVYYLSGCNQALVVPRVKKDGTLAEGNWFDLQRLDVDGRGKPIRLDNAKTPGFDAMPSRRF